jgi:hypothetical protein
LGMHFQAYHNFVIYTHSEFKNRLSLRECLYQKAGTGLHD